MSSSPGAETAATVPWTENAAGRGGREHTWTVLWRSRQLIGYLALRDLRLRYRQAALGVIWVLVQPVATVVVFTFVFDRLARIDTQGIPYPLFALTGLIAWTYFANATSRSSEVLVGNPSLVTKVYFPRMAAPAAGLLSPLVDLVVSGVLVAALAVYYGVWPGWNLLAAPLWLLFLLGTTLGVSLWLSAVNVRYRDVRHALGPALQLWLFASPVAYPASALTGWQELLYAVNPVVGIVEFGRWSLLGAAWPGWALVVSAASAGLLLVTGLAYFRRAERSFADVI
ncbi:ABC transporter permease [Geodermatophilus normandii]|uniref:Transport permease protein n=1 Tax=Geodermatophilus normandii TaxID=1137989 RepID=A0A6P0GF77_9ACTN|nr:ABC transporter permease [Geodermatophilus normandii]